MKKKKRKKLQKKQEKYLSLLATSGVNNTELVEFINENTQLHFKFYYKKKKKKDVKIILYKNGKKKTWKVPMQQFKILSEYVPRAEYNQISEDFLVDLVVKKNKT